MDRKDPWGLMFTVHLRTPGWAEWEFLALFNDLASSMLGTPR